MGDALDRLERDEVVRRTDGGYRLQSPQEKDWEKTRRGLDPRPADRVRMRRQLLEHALSGLSVTQGRTFKVELTVEGEKVLQGDLPLVIEAVEPGRRDETRTQSREPQANATVWWVFDESSATYEACRELYRSQQMVTRRDTPGKSAVDAELLGEERRRMGEYEVQALARMKDDLLHGQVIFRGEIDDPPQGELRQAAQAIVAKRVPDIYSRLAAFSAPVKRDDVLNILRADNLRGLPDYLYDGGIGLVRLTPEGVEIAVDRDPLAAVLAEIEQRANYGNEATGAHLERKFGAPPYGAPLEVVQALAAAGIRAGLVEAVAQGARISRADDARLDKVFGTVPAFRAASFRRQVIDLPLEVRTAVAERLLHLTGSRPPLSPDALGQAVRQAFLPLDGPCQQVRTALQALGLPDSSAADRLSAILARLLTDSDIEAVRTAHDTWQDLSTGRTVVQRLNDVLAQDMKLLQAALSEVRVGHADLAPDDQASLATLGDILQAGDFADHLGEVRSITDRVQQARRQAAETERSLLVAAIDTERARLRADYGGRVDESLINEMLRPLEALVPHEDATLPPARLLAADRAAAAATASQASRLLDEHLAAGQLVFINTRDLVPDAITSEDELQTALDRIRAAVIAALAEGKQVRLT